MFCPKCGKETPDGAQFCMNCGFNIGEFLNQSKAAAKQPAADAGSPVDAVAQGIGHVIDADPFLECFEIG